jgi:hypothetical protein
MRNLAGEAFILMTRLGCSVEFVFLFDSRPDIQVQVSDYKLLCLIGYFNKSIKINRIC